MNWLADIDNHHSRKYSQAGQDGLIEYIFQNIGTTNKFCVEFGFNSTSLTGGSGSNTARLVMEDGWKALLLDADNENLDHNLHRHRLRQGNIGFVFVHHYVPDEPDYVSIDVDGDDLWLMLGMLEAGFRPRLISVEYNARFPITVAATMKPGSPKWENDAAYGASLLALNMVAEEFGYRLIAVEEGLDAFFIRSNLLPLYDTDLAQFQEHTNIHVHPAPTDERMRLFVRYPSLEPLEEYPWGDSATQ